MKANSGTGRQRGNSHNDLYWKRLKGQFQSSAYDHTGAYSSLRLRSCSPEMATLRRQFDLAEQVMMTEGYKNLLDKLAYGKNTKRLSAVLAQKVPA